MQPQLKNVLQKRTRRAIGRILGRAEEDLYASITDTQKEQFRKLVIDVLNDYEGMVLDIMDGLDTGEVVLNDLWLTKIDEIWSTVVGSEPPRPASTGAGSNGHRSPSDFGGGRPRPVP